MDLYDGLVGHWPLDRQSFDQVTHQFIDKSAGENHGTGNGDNLGDTFNFVVGHSGVSCGATPFNGGSDYIGCGDAASFNFGADDFTISFWHKGSDTLGGLISQWEYSGTSTVWANSAFEVAVNSSVIYFRVGSGAAGVWVELSTAITDDVWRFITVLRSGNVVKILINTVEEDSGDVTGFTLPDSTRPLWLGRSQSSVTGYFDGSIEDIRIYDRALAQDEITYLYLKRDGAAYETMKVLGILEGPVNISKERSLKT